MAYLLSPGVLTTEKDYSLTVSSVSSTTGATVINSEWGRCEEIVSLFSENDILKRFYKPTVHPTDPLQSTYLDFYTMSNFFVYGNNLKVVRLVGENARNANVTLSGSTQGNSADLIIKNIKTFEARRNSGLLTDVVFAAKYPSELGNSLAVSFADKYSFAHWDFKTSFDYPPGDGEFSMVVIDTGSKWTTDAYLNVLEKFDGLSFVPGDRKFDGSSKYYKSAINNASQYVWVGEKDISAVVQGKEIIHSARTVSFTPTGGNISSVQSSLFSVVNTNLILKPEVVTGNGSTVFTQTLSSDYTITADLLDDGADPTPAAIAVVITTTSNIDILANDSFIISFMGDGASAPVTLAEADYTIDFAANTITIKANVLQEAGVVTVNVSRADTISVTSATYEVTLPNTTLASYQNIDVSYERQVAGIRRTLKASEFTRSNGAPPGTPSKIIIDAGIITNVAAGGNRVIVKLSKDPNPQKVNGVYTEANTNNPYSYMKLAGGVSDNNIGTLNDNNLANVCDGYWLFRNSNSIDISLIMMGQYCNPAIINWVISNIAEVRQDCVVFYSPTLDCVLDNPGKELEDVMSHKNAVNNDSTYAFSDSGWKYQYDRYNDQFHWMPLNPDIAGLCARTDYTNDPWWSPAGLNRGKIANVIKLAWNPGSDYGAIALSGTGVSGERDDLYQYSINPVITFPGEGTFLFGDKTATRKPSSFSRINVRRLFIVIKKSVAKTAKYFLFDFNDEMSRELFKLTMSPFFRDIEARRGIQKGGWKIICDDSNNTSEVIDRNEFRSSFLIKANRSINYIYLDFVGIRSDSSMSFSENQGL